MASDTFYPSVTTLINLDQIPIDNLGFIEDGLDAVLKGLYYKDFQVNVSSDSGNKFYSLTLVAYGRLGIEIPGTDGMRLVVNPGNDATLTTEIPISVGINIEILKFIQGFDLGTFTDDPLAFFNMFLDILGLDEQEIMTELIEILLGDFDDSVQAFVDQFNELNDEALEVISSPQADQIASLVEQIQELDLDVFQVVFDDFMSEVVGGIPEILDNVKALFSRLLGEISFENILELFKPDILLAINEIDLAIEFPRKWLIPLETSANLDPGTDEGEPLPEPFQSRLTYNVGSVQYTTEKGLEFFGENSFDFTKSQIGKTGLTLGFTNLKLDLSRTKNIPEAVADGRPEDFVGVFIEEAEIGLPAKWFKQDDTGTTLQIFGRNLILGTGGISGVVGLEAIGPTPDPELLFTLGGSDTDPNKPGFTLGFSLFDMEFQQNSIISSNVKGSVTIPKFEDGAGNPAKIEIEANFKEDGDFKITGREDDGIPICIPNVFELTVFELAVGRDDDRFFLELVGEVLITNSALSGVIPDPIQIKKLVVYDDGSIQFIGGGTIVLPEPKAVKVGPVELSVTALHFGSHEQFHIDQIRKYLYIGFDGGVNVNPGGVDARGDGIKFYFTIDNGAGKPFHFFMRIESIRIDLIIPGNVSPEKAALLLSGYLSAKDTPNGQEYIGGVSFDLPKAGIAGAAAMRLNPKVPAFLIDVGIELPSPITLGPTGLGIYGFRGLFGQKYVASQEAAGVPVGPHWYPYYKAKIAPDYQEGVQVSKFALEDGFSVGVGASIATVEPQEKKAFSSKVFLLLSLPEVFLIQGQFQVAKERLKLTSTEDPPFSFILAITSDSITVGAGVNYDIKEGNGDILELDAEIRMAFFFGNANAWYIHLGTDVAPIRGLLFKKALEFEVYAFLMLNSAGIKTGAGISFDQEYSLAGGVLSAKLSAYLDVLGKLNYKPLQVGASIQIGGRVELRAFGIGINITAALGMAAEVSNPFFITGFLEACIEINLWIKTFEVCGKIEFTWIFDDQPNTTPIPLHEAGDKGAKGRHIVTDESYSLYLSTGATLPNPADIEVTDANGVGPYIIPVDTYIDFEFLKYVKASSNVVQIGGTNGGGNTDKVPQKKGKLDQVAHQFIVDNVAVKFWNTSTGAWDDYDVYEALTPLTASGIGVTLPAPANRKNGWWQLATSGNKVNKITMLSQSPLEWTRQGSNTPVVLEDYGVMTSDIFCPPEAIEKHCFNFDDYNGDTVAANQLQFHDEVLFQIIGEDGSVQPIANPFDLTNGLVLEPGTQIEILFQQPTSCVVLKMLTCTDEITASYFEKRKVKGEVDLNGVPLVEYHLLETRAVTPGDLVHEIIYEDNDAPVERVLIEVGDCKAAGTLDCGELTAEAQDLEELLNVIAKQGLLLSQSFVSLLKPPYVQHYSPNLQKYVSGPHFYWAPPNALQTAGFNGMVAYIGNERAFCRLTLELVDGGNADILGKIVGFTDIAIDTDNLVAGDNFKFLISGVFQDGTIIRLRGCSDCYPIVHCTDSIENCKEEICEELKQQLEQLLKEQAKCSKQLFSLQRRCDAVNDPSAPIVQIYCSRIEEKQAALDALQQQIDNINDYINTVCDTTSQDTSLNSCLAYFFEMCYLSQEEFELNLDLTEFDDIVFDTQAMIESITQSLKPIWRPGTTYCIQLKTIDDISLTSNDVNYFNYGFRTEGPIGHWHTRRQEYFNLAAQEQEDEFALAKLKPYIDFEKSYPEANGNLLNTKPLFYDCPKLLLFFIYPHAYTMFNDFGAYKGDPAINISLDVIIKDPIEEDGVGTITPTWTVNSFGRQERDVTLLNNFINGQDCVEITDMISQGMNLEIEMCDLKPLKLYTAIYNSIYKGDTREVHTYPFQTSRYACFKEQVESYLLASQEETGVFREAFFDLDKDFDLVTEVQVAQSIFDDTMADTDPLRQEFMHPYDRLIDGALRLTAIEPAETTDFTMIRDTDESTGGAPPKVIGILIRNPEPFNDPKLEANDPVAFAESIQVVDITGTPVPGYSAIISKDGSKVFLSNDSFDITATSLRIRFQYFTFDGQAYAVDNPTKDEVIVEIDVVAPTTKLIDAHCNMTEVSIKDTLEVDLISGAVGYEFLIEHSGSGFSATYVRDDADGKFPLFEVDGLEYNKTYDVSVRPIISGRTTTFGTVCQITTQVLSYFIVNPIDSVQGIPVEVTIEVRDQSNNVIADFDQNVTLQVTGDAFMINPLVNIVGGRGLILVNDNTPETITLSLLDTEGTGLDVSATETITFGIAPAIKFEIIDPADGPQGTPITVTVQAINEFGAVDTNFQDDVTLLISGNGVTLPASGLVDIVNGVGTIDINDNVPEVAILGLFDSESTGLDVSSTQDVEFTLLPATQFVIINPVDGIQGVPTTVTIQAHNNLGTVDINCNLDVTLQVSGNATLPTAGGLVDIVNGVGTIEVHDLTVETVTLSLVDTEATGLDVSSVEDVDFGPAAATKFVIVDPADSVQGAPVMVTVRAENDFGDLDTNYNQDVTLQVTGSATLPSAGGLVDIINGAGVIEVNDLSAETVNLSLIDSESTGLDVSAVQDVVFALAPATKFIIINPQDSLRGVAVSVTVRAENDFGDIDVNFQDNVTLLAGGSAIVSNAGLIDIVNGIGSVEVNDSVAEVVNLSLSDTETTGLDVSDVEDIEFIAIGCVFEDSFTEATTDTVLELHSPDGGDSWTQLIQVSGGTLEVKELTDDLRGGVVGNGTGVLYTADAGVVYPNADYAIEATQVKGATDPKSIVLAVRIQDVDNMYAVRFNEVNSQLYKKVSGTWVALGAAGTGIANDSVARLQVVGNALTFFENYDIVLSETDIDISGAGKAGLGCGAVILVGDKIQNQKLDNIKVRLAEDQTRLFLDKFSGTGLLNTQAPDTGLSWTQVINNGGSNGIEAGSGTALKLGGPVGSNNSTGSFYTANISGGYPGADYEVEMKVVESDSGDNTGALGVRVQNSGADGYFVRFNNDTSQLYKRVGGVWTALGTPVAGVADGSVVRLKITGNTLSFTINNVEVQSETVTDHSAAGEAGLGIGAVMEVNDDEKKQEYDDFVVRLV